MLPKPRLGGKSATAKSTGSRSSGTTSKSLTMATRTIFGSRFQNAWIALPGRVEPFNSASPYGSPVKANLSVRLSPYVTNCCNEGDVIEALKDMLNKGMRKCRQFYKVKGWRVEERTLGLKKMTHILL
ncbi:unnamed protein product [Lupinus luteus]|uniref:Uncharacterized protein n=1 Tax=Lupinus luteus TaxID=3873 RepID=A0AAV1Y7L2_LUPLU